MLFGAHVSIAGGIQNSPKRSLDLGGEVFQIFSRSPRGGKAPEITSDIISEFNNFASKIESEVFPEQVGPKITITRFSNLVSQLMVQI